ncbi:IS701 family transposase [Actinomadura vinacea]
MGRIAPCFRRIESRVRARALLGALMLHAERRNCWTLAEEAGEPNPYRFQHLLSRAKWDDAAVRSHLRGYVAESLTGEGLRVLVVDETGDVKKGVRTVGVQRQYSGTAGRVENCQLAVYLALATAAGHAAVDVRLYLPRVWCEDAKRRETAGVPQGIDFATKPELAAQMIASALEAGVAADFVTGDEAYGINPSLRRMLEQRGLSYVLAVAKTTPVSCQAGKHTAAAALDRVPDTAWALCSSGAGAKGLRLYEWAWVELTAPVAGGHAGLLARRSRSTGEIAYFLTWTPEPVPLKTLVQVAGVRWRVKETFQGSKELTALDEHQVRTWTSWYRWVTLAMLAFAFLAITRTVEHRRHPDCEVIVALTCNEIRHLLVCATAPRLSWEHRLRWSTWRRSHQATAKRLHYQRQRALAA